VNYLNKEKILENEIEKASYELECESLKEERTKLKEILKLCEEEAKKRGLTK
jgi:hypothetical protein